MTLPLFRGRDLVIKSETGTGKTLGIVLGILTSVKEGSNLQAIFMVPTKELAYQIFQWISFFLTPEQKESHYAQVLVTDQLENEKQLERLSSHPPSILIGTPQRLLHLCQNSLLPSLANLRHLVVDEVDRVFGALSIYATQKEIQNQQRHPKPGPLVMDFLKEHGPGRFQTILSSATANQVTRRMALKRGWQTNPLRLQTCPDQVTLPGGITHQFVFAKTSKEVLGYIRQYAQLPDFTAGLIFLGNEASLHSWVREMKGAGFKGVFSLAGAYQHENPFAPLPKALPAGEGGEEEEEDQEAISPVLGIRQGKIKFLVANETMARGLDLPNISHVFVIELPQNIQSFFHESGRTGRMGRKGTVIGFFDPTTVYRARNYAFYLGLSEQIEIIEGSLEHDTFEYEKMHKGDAPIVRKQRKSK